MSVVQYLVPSTEEMQNLFTKNQLTTQTSAVRNSIVYSQNVRLNSIYEAHQVQLNKLRHSDTKQALYVFANLYWQMHIARSL